MCKEEIPMDAKKCGKCGAKQGNWAVRHPVWTAIIALFVIMVIASAGSDNKSSSTVNNNVDNTIPTETQTQNSVIETVAQTETIAEAPQTETMFKTEETQEVEAVSESTQDETLEDVDELEYKETVTEEAERVGDALVELSQILKEEPFVLVSADTSDEAYKKAVIDIATIQTAYSIVSTTEPPSKYADMHKVLVSGMKDYNDAVDKLYEGGKKIDTGLINEAKKLMESGSKKVVQAAAVITFIDQ